MTLVEFNKVYTYQSDLQKFGRVEVWEVPAPIGGKYKADCESYLLALQELTDELVDAELYYCRINGEGHCIAIRDDMVLDCNCQRWLGIKEYTKVYNMTDLSKYWRIGILLRKLSTKVFGYVVLARR